MNRWLLVPLITLLQTSPVQAGHRVDTRPTDPSCNSRNNYIERALPDSHATAVSAAVCQMSQSGTPASFAQADELCDHVKIPPACILGSMQTFRSSASTGYTRCNGDRRDVDPAGFPKACLSSRYHRATYQAFVGVMDCLHIPQREFFPLLNHESGFQSNARSHTGTLGIGQVTGDDIDYVNDNHLLSPFIEKKACSSYAHWLKEPMSVADTCQRISTPQNPARDLLYAGAVFLQRKAKALAAVEQYPLFSKMPPDWKRQAVRDLTRWMYNGGIDGIQRMLEGFTRENPNPMEYNRFRELFQYYVRDHYGQSEKRPAGADPDRRKEVASYVGQITQDLWEVEERKDVRCSED